MTEFASTLNSPAEERALLAALVETFEAIDVTGLSAWERVRAVHGRTAAGLAEGDLALQNRPFSKDARIGKPGAYRVSPSASPAIQPPLFEEAA